MITSLEGWLTKAKEAPSPHEVRLAPLDTNPVFQSLAGKLLKWTTLKEQLLKWMGYNKMNQSHGLSYDETLLLSYQKVPKVKIACSYSKEGGLYRLEYSPLM